MILTTQYYLATDFIKFIFNRKTMKTVGPPIFQKQTTTSRNNDRQDIKNHIEFTTKQRIKE